MAFAQIAGGCCGGGLVVLAGVIFLVIGVRDRGEFSRECPLDHLWVAEQQALFVVMQVPSAYHRHPISARWVIALLRSGTHATSWPRRQEVVGLRQRSL